MTETVNETQTAGVVLSDAWRQLAPIVDEAKQMQREVRQDPARLRDPWTQTHVEWLTVFEPELAAVQKVYEAVDAGAKLNADDVRAANDAAAKLYDIVSQARARVPQPA